MKKILIFFFAGVVSLSAGAQDTLTFSRGIPHWNIGVKAGVNLSGAYAVHGDFTTKPVFNFAGGFFGEIPIGRSLSLQPEFLLSVRGIKGKGTLAATGYSFTKTTYHFDVPLLLVVKPATFFSLLAGPQVSYLFKDTESFIPREAGDVPAFSGNRRKTNLALITGAEFIWHHTVLSTRLGWDMFRSDYSSSESAQRYKYVWYQITLGYTIH